MSYQLRVKTDKNISDTHGLIFVHIAKAAGTSVWKNLGMTKDDRGIFTILQLKDMIDNTKFNSYKKFTVVRNPWDRMVSLYEYRKKEGHEKYIYGDQDYSFKEWLMNPRVKGVHSEEIFFQKDFYENYFERLGMNWYRIHKHWLPQLNMISSKHDKILVDSILYFENLDSDWKELSKFIGTPLNPLGKHNTTKKKNYRDYYDEETKDYVSKLYWKDIEVLEYEY
jgi:hypothetical protein